MEKITYINRVNNCIETEKVFGQAALKLLYGNGCMSKIVGRPLAYLWARNPLFSSMYGWWQKQPFTKQNIQPFIDKFEIDATEFKEDVSQFQSFNDFFIRRLKPSARPIAPGEKTAIIPADGRYLFYPSIEKAEGFWVKGKKFQLSTLLKSEELAEKYQNGSMVIARLCPSDYHRFHFPCAGAPGKAQVINGWLYSVNPIALKRNIDIFTENKRMSQL